MSLKAASFFLALLFFSATCGAMPADSRACGGEGPSPLADISSQFQSQAKLVPSEAGVQEFLYWERKNKIIYRNANNALHSTSIGGAPKLFSQSSVKLSRLVDPEERFLATLHDTWVMDTAQGRWWRYQVPSRPVDPLFWHDRKLYGLNSRIDDEGNQTIRIYRYRIGDSSATVACTVSAKAGDIYQIAQGHSYPDVYLYRVRDNDGAPQITFYGVDVRRCRLFGMDKYTRPIAGPARSVHVFRKLESILVEVDHPVKNLLWDSPDGCRYHNINQLKPLVPNHNVPVVVTWSKEEGMSLIFLPKRKRAKVSHVMQDISFLPIESLQQKDLWMRSDAKRLFLSPLFDPDSSRWLVELTLGSVD